MYESHVTVDDIEEEDFLTICKRIDVKPILIEMDSGAGFLPQMMTGKFHKTDDVNVAKREMDFIASQFSSVIRKKLELIVGKRTELPEHLYLEFHSKFEIPNNRIYHFLLTVAELGGHTSVNSLKLKSESGNSYHFATSRDRQTMRKMITELTGQFNLVNTIMECVIYDDNPELDLNWQGCHDCLIKAVSLEGV